MKGIVVVIDTNEHTDKFVYDYMPKLDMLQQWVGGYIERVPMFGKYEGHDCVAFCNEEGKLEGLPINVLATTHWRQNNINTRDVLVGSIVVLYGDKEFMNEL